MLKNKTYRIVVAGLFATVGVILPAVTAHAFGIPGTILLPMHIPVILCGFLCGPRLGAICGLTVPTLSCLLTGMPVFYPMLPIMMVQLCSIGFISGLLYRKYKLNLYLSLLAAMLSGWAVYGLMFEGLLLMNSGLKALSVTAALAQGIPGIVIQLVLVPVIVSLMKKYMGRLVSDPKPSSGSDSDLDHITTEALKIISSQKISCVIIKDEIIVHTADGRGVSPLLKVYEAEPEALKNAYVVDKIIGKAAAMILVLGGATRAYGIVMSVAGRTYLEQYGIKAEYGLCVDVISNRDRNGICPIERSVFDIDDPQAGLAVMRATIDDLMRTAVNQ